MRPSRAALPECGLGNAAAGQVVRVAEAANACSAAPTFNALPPLDDGRVHRSSVCRLCSSDAVHDRSRSLYGRLLLLLPQDGLWGLEFFLDAAQMQLRQLHRCCRSLAEVVPDILPAPRRRLAGRGGGDGERADRNGPWREAQAGLLVGYKERSAAE